MRGLSSPRRALSFRRRPIAWYSLRRLPLRGRRSRTHTDTLNHHLPDNASPLLHPATLPRAHSAARYEGKRVDTCFIYDEFDQ